MLRLIILGPPASGKGTQARKLAEWLNLACLSTGALLRSEVQEGSVLGRAAQGFMDKGHFVPDEVVIGIVDGWLQGASEKSPAGWILDGFPRTMPQAKCFEKTSVRADRSTEADAVVWIDVPRAVLENRILSRAECASCGAITRLTSRIPKDGKITEPCPSCASLCLMRRPEDTPEAFAPRWHDFVEKTLPLRDFYASRGLLIPIEVTAETEAENVTKEIRTKLGPVISAIASK